MSFSLIFKASYQSTADKCLTPFLASFAALPPFYQTSLPPYSPMPSNRSMSPPKRRAHRSASSSSLIAPVVTTAHVRRVSRVPPNAGNLFPSLSNIHLPRFPSQSSFFPTTTDCESDAFPPQPIREPSLSDHPLSLPLLGATVHSLIRSLAK